MKPEKSEEPRIDLRLQALIAQATSGLLPNATSSLPLSAAQVLPPSATSDSPQDGITLSELIRQKDYNGGSKFNKYPEIREIRSENIQRQIKPPKSKNNSPIRSEDFNPPIIEFLKNIVDPHPDNPDPFQRRKEPDPYELMETTPRDKGPGSKDFQYGLTQEIHGLRPTATGLQHHLAKERLVAFVVECDSPSYLDTPQKGIPNSEFERITSIEPENKLREKEMIYLKGARSDSPDSFFGLPTRAELAALRAELQTSGVQESVLRAQLQVPGLQGIDIHPDTPHTSVEGLLRSLSPFRYSSTQDSRVESIALGIVQDPTFIDLEARAINPYVSAEPNASPQRLAEARYDTVIVDALPNRMASLSWTRGLEYIRGLDHTGELEHSGRLIYTKSLQADTPESIHSVSEQIDRVDFCPAQIRGTIETGKVRDAYVDGVSERVESINTGKL